MGRSPGGRTAAGLIGINDLESEFVGQIEDIENCHRLLKDNFDRYV
jgi:hypothetical protein